MLQGGAAVCPDAGHGPAGGDAMSCQAAAHAARGRLADQAASGAGKLRMTAA